MTGAFQPGANNYAVAVGTNPENVSVPHIDIRAPAASDYLYPLGKRWLDVGVGEYVLLSNSVVNGVYTANWSLLGTTGGGALNTLTGGSGGAIAPVANNITLAGTGSQITTTGTAGTITFSIPAAFIAPGSIASTTTLASGTSLAVGTSATVGTTLGVTGATTLAGLTQVGTASINASGAGVTTIGTGGTGAVNIGNATGNTAVTGTLTSSGNIITTAGNLEATGVASGLLLTPTVVAAGASPQTANGRVVAVTFSGVSIAAGATQTFVITNSAVTGAGTVILYSLYGATAGAALTIVSVTNSAGSSSIVVTNGTGATTSIVNITFTGLVLN